MRITTGSMARNLVQRLTANNRRVQELQDQLSTGRAIRRPSDDPVGASKAFRLKTNLAEIDRYRKNMQDAKDWLAATESALSKMSEALIRVQELATEAASDSLPQTSREAVAKEIDEIHQHLVDLANTDHGGRYVFAGRDTLTKPFTATGPSGPLDYGALVREIAPGQVMQINVTPGFLVGAGSVLELLPDLSTEVRAGDAESVSLMLSDIQAAHDEVLSLQAEVGAKVNRLEMSLGRLEESETSLTRLLSETEDADITELIVSLAQEEAVYRSALAVGARLVQPTLVDFLR